MKTVLASPPHMKNTLFLPFPPAPVLGPWKINSGGETQ